MRSVAITHKNTRASINPQTLSTGASLNVSSYTMAGSLVSYDHDAFTAVIGYYLNSRLKLKPPK